MSLLSEEALEFSSSGVDRGDIRRLPRTSLRLEMITEICAFLISYFFGGRLATLLGNARVVVDAKFADMKLGSTLGAFVKAAQGQG
ncbi:MAG: hypothetical protein FJ178_01170 [Gammaproteobacteria bacterium]|nr:hypothetical protein [Gammaproteobacteria bacterium]